MAPGGAALVLVVIRPRWAQPEAANGKRPIPPDSIDEGLEHHTPYSVPYCLIEVMLRRTRISWVGRSPPPTLSGWATGEPGVRLSDRGIAISPETMTALWSLG